MTIRDAVRTTIIGTNAYWPFSSLNKVPYHVAIKAFIHLCKGYPEVKSIYLRSAARDWVPGLSDIDLTVTTDSRLTFAQEFSFLRNFWKKYARLKQLFPMYGEIDILSDHTIGSWTRFGLLGHSARNWKLVYGVETVHCNYHLEAPQFSIDCLNSSLHYMHWYYRSYFENKFVDQTESSYLLSKDLKRLASKIIRCLAHFDPSEVRYKTQDELLCGVITKLEQAVSLFAGRHSIATDKSWADVIASRYHEPVTSEPFRMDPSDTWTKALETVTVDVNNRFYFVLKNGVDRSTLNNCVQNAKRILGGSNGSILVLSASVFEYMVRYYEPFEYVHLMKHRKVVFGKDMLPRIPPPSKDAFIDFLLHQVPNVITYPQSREFCALLERSDSAVRDIALMLERSLFLKLYWEHGTILPVQQTLHSQCEQQYPEWFASLNTFRETSNEQSVFKLFTLLRNFTNDVHKYLN